MSKTVAEPSATEAPSKKARKKPEEKAAPAGPQARVQVRYARTMRPQRVHSLIVEQPRSKTPPSGPVVVIRPVIAGALVSPPEQRFDLSRKGERITFQVTPQATGPLPRSRLEVFAPGQPLQEIPLKMKVSTGRAAWWMLLATVVLPWLLYKFTIGSWTLNVHTLKDTMANEMKRQFRGIPVLGEEYKEMPLGLEKFNLSKWLPDIVGDFYAYLSDAMSNDRILLYVILGLLILTFLTWVLTRKTKRKRQHVVMLSANPAENTSAIPLQPM